MAVNRADTLDRPAGPQRAGLWLCLLQQKLKLTFAPFQAGKGQSHLGQFFGKVFGAHSILQHHKFYNEDCAEMVKGLCKHLRRLVAPLQVSFQLNKGFAHV